ncbi:Ppx/GppA family phosphatase [Roseomonas gilardii]|uniref:Ppx/GppA family phosphatase n=1 Tax=Roseomonas gilardii TaxID=257708 RepID=UPI0011A4E38A|nr:Ppx/GppA family phosphatase [Roseomonas gilardii]
MDAAVHAHPAEAIPHPPRCGVVDLGSNSVRLVVFEGRGRNPMPIFNEKAVLGLGRGLETTRRLNEEAVEQALTVLERYHAVARAMAADPLEILATAAMRDAENGPAFAAALRERMPGVPITVLSGEGEATLSAEGVLLGFPEADGILGDIGGGSLEVVDLRHGRVGDSASLPLGVIRLAERAGGDMAQARAIAEAELARVPWLSNGKGRDLYLVGGAWRAIAKVHMVEANYPLSIVHHYVLTREEARNLCGMLIGAKKSAIEKVPGVPAKRAGDLPFAAVALRRLLRATGADRVVFSANGLREGWYARHIAPSVRAEDPLLAASYEMAARFGRDDSLPPALFDWTSPLFPEETAYDRALRLAACWLSDTGSHDHPDYRAEQSFLRILRQPGVGLDHHARAFLALAVALRYEAAPPAATLAPARVLLGAAEMRRAELLGAALRLAYTLSGGTLALLNAAALSVADGTLHLTLRQHSGLFAGEGAQRRLDLLAGMLNLKAGIGVG